MRIKQWVDEARCLTENDRMIVVQKRQKHTKYGVVIKYIVIGSCGIPADYDFRYFNAPVHKEIKTGCPPKEEVGSPLESKEHPVFTFEIIPITTQSGVKTRAVCVYDIREARFLPDFSIHL